MASVPREPQIMLMACFEKLPNGFEVPRGYFKQLLTPQKEQRNDTTLICTSSNPDAHY